MAMMWFCGKARNGLVDTWQGYGFANHASMIVINIFFSLSLTVACLIFSAPP